MATKKVASTKRRTPERASGGAKHTTTGSKKKKKKTKARGKKKIAINIRRSSGRKEKFDVNRMAQTTGRSGVPFVMARDIAKNVSKKIIRSEAKESNNQEKTVTAAKVRDMIAEELQNRNEQTKASSYVGQVPENTQNDSSGHGGRYVAPIGNADTRQHEAYRADGDSVMHDQSKRHQSST